MEPRYALRYESLSFDRDAVTLTAPKARRMLSSGGFEMLRMDFLFIFPACFVGCDALRR